MKYLCLFVSLLVSINLLGQHDFKKTEEELTFHADVMVNAMKPAHRINAFDNFSKLFVQTLKTSGSLNHPFDSLVWVSKKEPRDKSFRIFTWFLKETDDLYKYAGVIQMADGTCHVLTDKLKEMDEWEYGFSDVNDWMGALYYNMMESEDKAGKYYLLFGLHQWNKDENVKLVDVLNIDKEGEITFGREVFRKENGAERPTFKTRLVLKYAAETFMNLNYNPGLGMIVHDNLIPRFSKPGEKAMVLVPDGSLIGYNWDKKYWNYVDKIYTQILDEAPRPNPILDKQSKDIFGKKDKKKRG